MSDYLAPAASTRTIPRRGAPQKTNRGSDPYISRPGTDTTDRGQGKEQADRKSNHDPFGLVLHKENGQVALDKEAIYELVERAKNEGPGSEAFASIYRLYHAQMFRFARFRLPREAAEDAVAETFTRALQNLPKYKPTGAPFVSWLYGIARHVVLDAGTAERRVEPRAEFADEAKESPFGTADRIVLADAIKSLPEKQRQVIELKFLIGATNEEVGAALGKSPGAVNAQQWRALEALKKILEKR